MNLDAPQSTYQALDGRLVLLDVTYHNDPEINALTGSLCSERFLELTKSSLNDGRLRNDLMHLGLPAQLEFIRSISEVDAQTVCIQAGVRCTKTSRPEGLASFLDEYCNAGVQKNKIKSIVMVNDPSFDTVSHGSSSVTTLVDYYRQTQLPEPPNLCISPSLIYSSQKPLWVDTADHSTQANGFVTVPPPHHVIPSGMNTPPDSPLPLIHKKWRGELSAARDLSMHENSLRSELEEEIRADFESTLEQRMAELQATFNQEKRELETCIDSSRTEFEALLAERLAEVQAEFNIKEVKLKAVITQAQEHANHERFLRLRDKGHVPAASSPVHSPLRESEDDYGVFSSETRETLERQVFAATLEAALQERRLKDVRLQWSQSEKQLAQSKNQLESMARDLEGYRDALSFAKNRIADAEKGTPCQGCMNLANSKRKKSDSDLLDISKMLDPTAEYDATVDPAVTQCPAFICLSCDVKQRSLRLSKMHIRAMELRMSMSERRVIETEKNAIWLVHSLQQERRDRNHAEAAFHAERQRRHAAEAKMEVISREARSPFVVPSLFDLFLKFEEMFDDLTSV